MVREWIHRLRQNVAPNWDKYDTRIMISLAILLGLLLVISFRYNYRPTYVLAVIATVTAYIAIYQLRHARGGESEPTMPAVRQDFQNQNDSKSSDFGLRNYGPGPALYLQSVAKVNGETQTTLTPHQYPLHLAEGEFVGLVRDELQETLDEGTAGEVELFYSYVSVEGVREPTNLDNPEEIGDAECLFERITADNQEPRTMSLNRIRKECT